MLTDDAVLMPIDVQQAFDDPAWGRRNNPGMEARGLAPGGEQREAAGFHPRE